MMMDASQEILIIEDDLGTAEMQRRRLNRAGFQVALAQTAEEALARIKSGTVALVVLDYRLANHSTGLELYKEFKEHGYVPPTILVTGFSDETLVVQALRAGIDDFIPKSVDYLEYLPLAIQRLLAKAKAERQLADSEARKTAILNVAMDAIITMDVDGTIIEFNPAAEKIFGYPREQAVGQSMAQLILPPPARQSFLDSLRHFLDTGDEAGNMRRRREIVALDRNENELNIELALAPTACAVGLLFTAYIRDLRHHKQLEVGLRLRQRAIDEVSEGIVFTDANQADDPIVYANPAFERMTGYSLPSLIGRNIRFLHGPATDRQSVNELREAIAQRRPCTVEMLNYRASGTPFWNAISVTPLHDDRGAVTHFIGIHTDVTERRLIEEQMRQSQKMEAIGRLAGGIAHDFNNILTIILGNAEFLTEGLRSEHPDLADLRELAEVITESGNRAASLTRQLLAFSRKQMIHSTSINLNEVITKLEKMLRRLIGEDVTLTLRLNPELGKLKSDAAQIDQIIMNLVVNARDAMPQGGSLTIETENLEVDSAAVSHFQTIKPGSYVRLSVGDTGQGIPPDVIHKIFEPFFTTKGLGEGTGMGLATVFGIVKQSEGHVEVHSEVGVGTQFNVYFPRFADTETVPTVETPSPPPLGKETVLLVEDESRLRQLAREILSSAGYQVIEAENGEEALRVVDRFTGPIELLITDVIMPGVSGREVAEQVLQRRPTIKTLYMSGYTGDAVVLRGILEQDKAFLQKPFSKDALIRKVREVLDA